MDMCDMGSVGSTGRFFARFSQAASSIGRKIYMRDGIYVLVVRICCNILGADRPKVNKKKIPKHKRFFILTQTAHRRCVHCVYAPFGIMSNRYIFSYKVGNSNTLPVSGIPRIFLGTNKIILSHSIYGFWGETSGSHLKCFYRVRLPRQHCFLFSIFCVVASRVVVYNYMNTISNSLNSRIQFGMPKKRAHTRKKR